MQAAYFYTYIQMYSKYLIFHSALLQTHELKTTGYKSVLYNQNQILKMQINHKNRTLDQFDSCYLVRWDQEFKLHRNSWVFLQVFMGRELKLC